MTDEQRPTIVLSSNKSTMDFLAPAIPPVEIKDPITAPPVVSGPHGKAWLCDAAAGRVQLGFREEDDGTLAHWIIEAPWAHPAWHSYSIILIHLRPMPDNRPTLFYLDGATHEFWVYAINPDMDRNELLSNGMVNGHWLSPKNFAAQFIEVSDDLARGRVQAAVQAICDGKLSPDVDYQSMWASLFGDNMMKNRPNRKPPEVK